jgi:hypothetical protein
MNFNASYILFAFALCFVSCNEPEEATHYNSHLLFPEAVEIFIDPYQYIDPFDSISYKVAAGTLADTLGRMPEFRWRVTASSLLTVCISRQPFVLSNNQIVNEEDIIWQWHTGLNQEIIELGETNYVKIPFKEGRPLKNKNILYNTQPLALESGLYFWSVWGWDKSGKKISYSSPQIQFIVK